MAAPLLIVLVASVPPGQAADLHDHIVGFAFSPRDASIEVGDTITWHNHDGATHTATDRNCPRAGGPGPCEFDSLNLGTGATFSHTFNAAASFNYLCTIHGFTGTISVAVPGGVPDLVVDQLTFSPLNPIATDDVVFTARVRNAGNGAAGAFAVRFFVDGAAVGTTNVANLGAGATSNVASPAWFSTEGTHDVRAVADADLQVGESNEGNNERTTTITVAKLIRAVSVTPESQSKVIVPPNLSVRYDFTIKNDGNKVDTMRLTRTDPPGGWSAVINAVQVTLAPGATVQVSLTVRLNVPAVPAAISAPVDLVATSLDPNVFDAGHTTTYLLVQPPPLPGPPG